MDNKKILNDSKQCNYISGNKIFILDGINQATTAELIGNLSNLVDSLPFKPIQQITPAPNNPYQIIENDYNIIDVYINSNGGSLSQTKSIMALLNMARAKGAVIRTTVLGTAASAASLIAIQGTKNFRIMYEQSYNLVHYGHSHYDIDRADEMEKAAVKEKNERALFNAPYLKYTDLTQNDLKKLQKTEFGHMDATQCLAKGLCDWILTTDGIFINKNTKQR